MVVVWRVLCWGSLLLSWCTVHAVVPMVPQYFAQYQAGSWPVRGPASSWDAACLSVDADVKAAALGAGYADGRAVVVVSGSQCRGQYLRTPENGGDWFTNASVSVTQGAAACPANSAAVEGGCACASGYQESGNACVPEPDECQKLAGQTAGYKNYEGKADEFFFCDGWNSAGGGKCVVKVERGLSWEDPPGSGHWFSQGKGVYTGQKGTSCNGSGGNGDGPAGSTPKPPDGKEPDKPDPGTAAPAPCPQGQSAGEVNGQRVCAPRGTDSPVEVKSSSSSTNANGDKTDTTKETKCDGSKCTTTTTDCTTLNGQTSSTCSSTSSTVSAGDACKANSSLSVCGDGEDGSSFSGSCASGFQCKGDAIQCAMAQEQHKQRCDFVNWSSTWKQTGETPVTGVRQGFEQSAGGSQFTAWLNQPSETAACPAGKPMQLLGQSYVLSFDPLCEVGEGARPIVLAVAVLLALRTFMRVVLVG